MISTSARAVIWDFDGTLIDTREKNLAVNRRIIEEITGRGWSEWSALRTVDEYERAIRRSRNWRELYGIEFGLSGVQTDRAGAMWSDLHARDETPTTVFDGIEEALATLHQLPHGIVSQNARPTIEALLGAVDLTGHFTAIIGYEEVGRDRQKPHPEGLLACIELLLSGEHGTVLFIGDHPTDAECAALAAEELAQSGSGTNIVAVAACFGSVCDADEWATPPQHVARHPRDITEIAGIR